jgi:hypothetical protein
MKYVALAAVLAALCALAGCATSDQESDLPWNMTQPWETAPTMPFGGAGY